MDLGFGDKNQEIGEATANALMRGAEAHDRGLDSELARYDRLLDDEDALEDLRQRRIQELKKQYSKQQKYRDLGHGKYTELGMGSTQESTDIAREFFQTSKESDRIVVHFYRPSTRYCDTFHAHLTKLAEKHLETKFMKINVEGCDNNEGSGASFLVERLGVVVMPTLVLIKNRKAFHHIRGFDELGGTDDFSTNMLAHVLGTHGVTDLRDDEEMSEDFLRERGINTIRIRKGAKKGGYSGLDDFE